MDEGPFFFEPSILKICIMYDIKTEQLQLLFNYGMRNPESVDDGQDDNNGSYARFEDCNCSISGSIVQVGATTIESMSNHNYSIHILIIIVACSIRFPANI